MPPSHDPPWLGAAAAAMSSARTCTSRLVRRRGTRSRSCRRWRLRSASAAWNVFAVPTAAARSALDLQELWRALWQFADVPDVEPTNNAADADCAPPSCRLQRRSLYAYLSDALTAKARGDPVPNLA